MNRNALFLGVVIFSAAMFSPATGQSPERTADATAIDLATRRAFEEKDKMLETQIAECNKQIEALRNQTSSLKEGNEKLRNQTFEQINNVYAVIKLVLRTLPGGQDRDPASAGEMRVQSENSIANTEPEITRLRTAP